MSFLRRFLGGGPRRDPPSLVQARTFPPALYAIGDVHGCLSELKALEAKILSDAEGIEGEKWLVMLGDLVDRGPSSAQVIDHLMSAPPKGFRRVCLRGNHEAMMLAALSHGSRLRDFLQVGGETTLRSYGMDSQQIAALARGSGRKNKELIQAYVPDEHIKFLASLPMALRLPGYVLVHAGLRPGIALELQTEADMLWIREDFTESGFDFRAMVLHGHTRVNTPDIRANRINIDTGCYASGRLTALRLVPGQELRFLQTEAREGKPHSV